MTYYYFTKINLFNSNVILAFEQGQVAKPSFILDEEAIERLIKEWNEVKK